MHPYSYNEVWTGNLPLSVTKLPKVMKCKRHLKKKAENYLADRIPGRSISAIMGAMEQLKAEYGNKFA